MRWLPFWVLCGTVAKGIAGPSWQHALFLEPNGESLQVTEVFRCENDGSAAAPERVRVYIPSSGMQGVTAMVERPELPAVRLSPRPTSDADVYELTPIIKPGVTTVQVRYSFPASKRFTGRTFGAAPVRLVVRRDVTLTGNGIRFVSREPHSQANLYDLVGVSAGEPFEILIDESTQTRNHEPKRGPAHIVGAISLLIGLSALLLCVSGVLIYRRGDAKRTVADRGLLVCWAAILMALAQVTKGAVEPRFAVIGERAPNFSLRTDDGRKLSPDSFGGKLLVMNFWATWCQPCVIEMPSLSQFANEMEKEGVVIVAVSIDEEERAYRDFLSRLRPQFLTGRDAASDLASEFGTFKVPETYVIDRTGRVLQKYINSRDWMDPAIRAEMRAFLRKVQ